MTQYPIIPASILAEAWQAAPSVYVWLGLCGGYALVMLFAPVRQALGDGLHCLRRYQRIWITFAVLGFGYFVFQFVTFTPIRTWADLELSQITSLPQWSWPRLSEIWQETLLPALEGVAGIFDNATTTYPLSVVAAVLLIVNWRGLHGALVRALRKRYGFWGYLAYLILLLSALASLLKPMVFWRLPEWSRVFPEAGLLRISATVDATAFIFEYLLGVYIQVYLITVCLAWTKGVSFEEGELFRFAMRRFSYVLEWAGIVVAVSTLIVRLPLVLAYYTNIPGVLDYLPIARVLMSGLIIAFCSVQISLALHNETLIEAMRAHMHFIQRNAGRLVWFLMICGVHFYCLILCDSILRGAIADRLGALFLWKFSFACLRGLITGWLLASWVCLFRQCEAGRVHQEKWIQY
ncbi:MAG TPA: hypothetical protein VGM65_04155 [Candidatus Udaeobacter sp.]